MKTIINNNPFNLAGNNSVMMGGMIPEDFDNEANNGLLASKKFKKSNDGFNNSMLPGNNSNIG